MVCRCTGRSDEHAVKARRVRQRTELHNGSSVCATRFSDANGTGGMAQGSNRNVLRLGEVR